MTERKEKNYFVIEYSRYNFRIVNQKPLKTWEEANILRCECYARCPEGRFVVKSEDDD